MTDVLILGAGGHARVVAEALRQCGSPAVGYVDRVPAGDFSGLRYAGTDEAMMARGPAGVSLANGVGSVDVVTARRDVFGRYRDAGFSFVNVIHPAALIASTANLGEGTQVMAGAIVQADARLGRNVLVNTRAVIEHDCVLADHVHVATGAIVAGGVRIGEATHIGTGAAIIQGVRIGANALIAAGATVTADVADGARVAGTPARPI